MHKCFDLLVFTFFAINKEFFSSLFFLSKNYLYICSSFERLRTYTKSFYVFRLFDLLRLKRRFLLSLFFISLNYENKQHFKRLE